MSARAAAGGRRATPTCCSTCRGCSPTRSVLERVARARLPRPRPGLHPALARRRRASTCASTPTPTSSPSADAIGSPGGPIPGCGRTWIPTLPPVVLDEWPVAAETGSRAADHGRPLAQLRLDPPRGRPLRPEGALAALRDRAARRAPGRLALALAIHPDERADLEALEAQRLGAGSTRPRSPATPTPTAASCRARGRSSRLAKSGYVVGRLRLVQRSQRLLPRLRATGDRPGHRLRPQAPGGRGAARVLGRRRRGRGDRRRCDADYERHRRAARELAEEHLDSDLVLGSLLERLLP